jgi:uncharacterized protein
VISRCPFCSLRRLRQSLRSCRIAAPALAGGGGDSAAAPSAAAPSATSGGSDAGRGPRARPIPGEEHEFTSDEADQDTYEGEEVDLDRFVREAILLESPIFPLCSDACRGIGPPPSSPLSNGGSKAGAIDPRLLPLVELARKRSSKE